MGIAREDLLKEWDFEKNGEINPESVKPSSHRKVWWRCECGHEWQAQVRDRVRNNAGCPVCANKVALPGENDLATTHPTLAAQWHKEYNGSLTPKDIVAGSHCKVWWRCERGHEWQAQVRARALNNTDCPVCAGKTVIPGENDLASQFPQLAGQWAKDLNGKLTPHQVAQYSHRSVWWRCEKGHVYRASISARANKGTGCPYCAGRKVLAGFNDLETLEPALAAQWHGELNGALTPQMVTVGSGKKVWWQCPFGHVWKAVIYARAGGARCGCPVCAGKAKKTTADI